MNSVKARELLNDGGKLLMKAMLRVFHFAHVELADAGDLVALVDNSWCLTLGAGKDA